MAVESRPDAFLDQLGVPPHAFMKYSVHPDLGGGVRYALDRPTEYAQSVWVSPTGLLHRWDAQHQHWATHSLSDLKLWATAVYTAVQSRQKSAPSPIIVDEMVVGLQVVTANP